MKKFENQINEDFFGPLLKHLKSLNLFNGSFEKAEKFIENFFRNLARHSLQELVIEETKKKGFKV